MSSKQIEGIPDGWELVRIGKPFINERYISLSGKVTNCVCIPSGEAYAIVRKVEKPKKPKQYRPFANPEEYFANRREGSAVDGKNNTIAPGFFAVVSANQPHCWVAFGTKIVRFDWAEAFEHLQFRHVDNSTSPFGIEVTE